MTQHWSDVTPPLLAVCLLMSTTWVVAASRWSRVHCNHRPACCVQCLLQGAVERGCVKCGHNHNDASSPLLIRGLSVDVAWERRQWHDQCSNSPDLVCDVFEVHV